jgi:hypothetical protein
MFGTKNIEQRQKSLKLILAILPGTEYWVIRDNYFDDFTNCRGIQTNFLSDVTT